MRLIKPSWVTHDGFPIFSLDVHPDGSRFATGGQGAGDSGRVVIWNMAPVVDEAQEVKENVPKYLSRMDNHLNCVNCVRWSLDGKYLASGGDDKIIIIWQMARVNHSTTNHASSFTSSAFSGSNVETYRCVATLRGHGGDVLDMNWSPIEPRLASCSVDNSIIIWNTSRWTLEHVISGHTGLVKGVSWDPIGKYLASQSDDKSLKIWRTSDWKEDHCLTEPFLECGGTTHVLRLNWSPDGQQLVSAHAMNNCGSVAQIINRETWAASRDFVGHRKAVTCVRFNPLMFKKKKEKGSSSQKKKEKELLFSCVAVGSRDRSVSVWMTCLPRPLVVVHELFSNSVLDTSWSPDGRRLLACSWDGSVACLDFEPAELGTVISSDETNVYLEKLYGKMTKSNENNHVLVEDVDIIKAREEREKRAMATTSPTNGHQSHQESLNCSLNDSRSNTSSRLLKGPTDKQIEVKLVSGKRRITPLYIPPPMDLDGIPLPYNHQEINFSTSTDQKSRIPIERREDSSNLSFTSPTSKSDRINDQFQTPKVTSPHEISTPKGSKRKNDPSKGDSSPAAKRKPGRPPGSQSRVSSQEIRTEPLARQELVQNIAEPTACRLLPPPTSNVQQATMIKKSENRKNRIQLSGLRIEKSASFLLPNNRVIEVENNLRNTAVCVLRLVSKSNGKDITIWEVVLTSKITAVTACDFMSAVVTEENLVSVFSTKTGRRLHLPIVLNSPVSRIESTSFYLMLITIDGRLSVYDFNSHTSIVRNESLLSLFNDGGKGAKDSPLTINHAEITTSGTPVISLSNKKSFIFDPSFKHWSLLSNPVDLLNSCSDLKPSGYRSDPDAFPLARIQAFNSRGLRPGTNVFGSISGLQSNATISFIDQQLAASFVVGSKAEYKFWLLALAQALTNEGREDRLRELSSFLMEPMFNAASSDGSDVWSPTILGHDKKSLLNEVLSIMTSNLKLQRLYTEFKDQITFSDMISASDPLMSCASRGSNTRQLVSGSLSQAAANNVSSIRQEIRMQQGENLTDFINVNHGGNNLASKNSDSVPINGHHRMFPSLMRGRGNEERDITDVCENGTANGFPPSIELKGFKNPLQESAIMTMDNRMEQNIEEAIPEVDSQHHKTSPDGKDVQVSPLPAITTQITAATSGAIAELSGNEAANKRSSSSPHSLHQEGNNSPSHSTLSPPCLQSASSNPPCVQSTTCSNPSSSNLKQQLIHHDSDSMPLNPETIINRGIVPMETTGLQHTSVDYGEPKKDSSSSPGSGGTPE